MAIRMQKATSVRLDEIYPYTRDSGTRRSPKPASPACFPRSSRSKRAGCIRGPCQPISKWRDFSSDTSGISCIRGTSRTAISVLSRSSTSGCIGLIISRRTSSDRGRITASRRVFSVAANRQRPEKSDRGPGRWRHRHPQYAPRHGTPRRGRGRHISAMASIPVPVRGCCSVTQSPRRGLRANLVAAVRTVAVTHASSPPRSVARGPVPGQGIPDHHGKCGALRNPAQVPQRPRASRDQADRIAGTSRPLPDRNRLAGDRLAGLNHLPHRVAVSRAEIEHAAFPARREPAQPEKMGIHQIGTWMKSRMQVPSGVS